MQGDKISDRYVLMWKILGIEPTDDLKKIKAAYAALAKKFNPEEYPDEFRRIFDAYKSASAYAKRRSSGGGSGSGSRSGKNDPLNFDFYNEKKSDDVPEEIPEDNSRSDENSRGEVHDEISPSEDFDFTGIDISREYVSVDEILDKLRLYFLSQIRNILDRRCSAAEKEKMWYKLFSEPDFKVIVNDDLFRTKASALIVLRTFDRRTAKLICDSFGNGTAMYLSGVFIGDYIVLIPKPGKSYDPRDRVRAAFSIFNKDLFGNDLKGSRNVNKYVAYIIILIVFLSFVIWPVYYFSKGSEGYSPPQTAVDFEYVPIDAYSVFYQGKWRFKLDGEDMMLEFFLDGSFVIYPDGQTASDTENVIKGTIDCDKSKLSAGMFYFSLCADSERFGGAYGSVAASSDSRMMRIVLTDKNCILASRVSGEDMTA